MSIRKPWFIAAAATVLTATLVLGHSPALADVGGPTCNVPADYPTIQAAVNAAGCTTINVAPGVYNESVVVPRSLTLNGAKKGVDARPRSGVVGESVINGAGNAAVTVNASNVTVDGFTLVAPVNQGSAAVVMMGAYTGELIQNNVFQNPGRAASFTTSNTTFRRNAVHATATAGDGFQLNSSAANNVAIVDNSFDGATSPDYNADFTMIGLTTVPSTGIVVTGNSSAVDSTLVAIFNTTGGTIANNTVTDPTGSAIYIGGNDHNITITANIIAGGALSAVKVANAFGDGPNSNITVTGNTLKNNAYGVNVTLPAITAVDTIQVHQNNIAGNTLFGVNNDSGIEVNATCNWWGSASGPGPVGPGMGDRVSTNVVYAPWLIAPAPGSACYGGNVPADKDQCKKDGWMTQVRSDGSTFKNQGDCIQYANTGK